MGFKARERVVTVYYQDIATWNGWHDLDEDGVDRDKPLECAVTGFLVSKDNEMVRVAHHVSVDGVYAEVSAVPAGCVRRIVYHGTAGRKKVAK